MVCVACGTVEAVHAHQTVDRLELHEIRSLRRDCPEVDRACSIETCAIQHTTRTTCNMQQAICAVSGTDRAVAASEGEVVRVDPTFDRACLAHMPAEGNHPFENKRHQSSPLQTNKPAPINGSSGGLLRKIACLVAVGERCQRFARAARCGGVCMVRALARSIALAARGIGDDRPVRARVDGNVERHSWRAKGYLRVEHAEGRVVTCARVRPHEHSARI